jgi:hypothetical protein
MIKKVDKRHIPQLEEKLEEYKKQQEFESQEIVEGLGKSDLKTLFRLMNPPRPDSAENKIKLLDSILLEIKENEIALLETHDQWMLGEDFTYYL